MWRRRRVLLRDAAPRPLPAGVPRGLRERCDADLAARALVWDASGGGAPASMPHVQGVPLDLPAVPDDLSLAIPKRRWEFRASRWCARQALGALGSGSSPEAPPHDGGAGDDTLWSGLLARPPRWPPGRTGSITHTRGFAAALVASTARWRGVGIDAEDRGRRATAARIASRVATDGEVAGVSDTLALSADEALLAIFSAKESVYKALNPLVGRYFGFHDARVVGTEASTTHLVIELIRDLGYGWSAGSRVAAGVALEPDLVVTWVLVPAGGAPAG